MVANPNRIVITGASSGIGAALAEHYAAPGVFLALSARNKERLDLVAEACRVKGAQVQEKIIDVTDRPAMNEWLDSLFADAPLDLVIANAGISGGTGGAQDCESPEQIREIFDINLTGVLNTIDPVLPKMLDLGQGQIGLMSSLASFSGWSGAPAYSASKGAVRMYAEGLRGAIKGTGVQINAICPGFIKTPMTAANGFPMPFMMDSQKAARIIARGLARNKGRIAFPWQTYGLAGFFGMLPHFVSSFIFSRLPDKPARD